MMPTRAEILARYSKKETVADRLGRLISVVNLKFSERLAIRRMAETEDGLALAYMNCGASVRDIDGIVFPFPRTLAELNSTIDVLDEEGMIAAMTASAKLRGDTDAASEEGKEPKNSQASPASGSSPSSSETTSSGT